MKRPETGYIARKPIEIHLFNLISETISKLIYWCVTCSIAYALTVIFLHIRPILFVLAIPQATPWLNTL